MIYTQKHLLTSKKQVNANIQSENLLLLGNFILPYNSRLVECVSKKIIFYYKNRLCRFSGALLLY